MDDNGLKFTTIDFSVEEIEDLLNRVDEFIDISDDPNNFVTKEEYNDLKQQHIIDIEKLIIDIEELLERVKVLEKTEPSIPNVPEESYYIIDLNGEHLKDSNGDYLKLSNLISYLLDAQLYFLQDKSSDFLQEKGE